MELAKQQAEAADKIVHWFKHEPAKQVFYLAGFAGTGKTTIYKYLIELLSPKNGYVTATFTGKAASVMSRKGISCSTIHSLIYKVVPPSKEKVRELQQKLTEAPEAEKGPLRQEIKEANKPHYVLRDREDSLAGQVSLIGIDEVSMVDEAMGSDLLSYGTKILVLGDPGQLPPIQGAGFFTNGSPDFMLTEIHRQAQGNPIISMATTVRKGLRLGRGSYGDSKVISRHQITGGSLSVASQVIAGRNATRKSLNSSIRDELGYHGSVPIIGEKIICLKNDKELGILNGTQWRVEDAEDGIGSVKLSIRDWDDEEAEKIEGIEAHSFDKELTELPFWERNLYQEFDFGYAITCHKSQGSQWDHVFIQDESWVFSKTQGMAAKWLYTAITRAEGKVTVAV